ncbi:GDP-mannose 4,6-dehydratase [Alphaproteobacteria bacterium]|nr:GDP-mannose 4,6-dehydratase [Alphaproteobacteria bacterium]
MKKKALIFGVTGQDGAYLSKFLISKDYEVHGVKRKSSSFNTSRLDDIYEDINSAKSFFLHYGDVMDGQSISQLIIKINPDEIYNLSAQSHVAVSFELPEYTFSTNALGTLKILESIKNINKKIKFYQASTSEMFGSTPPPQCEMSSFSPQSSYAVSKLAAYWLTVNYRNAYSLFACNGILFNHESPIRGGTFITKKIISGLVNIKYSKQKKIYVGNLYSKRDWGHASDYVKAMWLMLQQKKPDDFVIATGNSYTVKKFIELTAKKLDMTITWKGKDLLEKCYWNKKCIIEVKKKYFRPTEVNYLKGNATKARKLMDWSPKHDIHSLIDDMINYEINLVKN